MTSNDIGFNPATATNSLRSIDTTLIIGRQRDTALYLEMNDEIFTFESFINLMKFLEYFKTPF